MAQFRLVRIEHGNKTMLSNHGNIMRNVTDDILMVEAVYCTNGRNDRLQISFSPSKNLTLALWSWPATFDLNPCDIGKYIENKNVLTLTLSLVTFPDTRLKTGIFTFLTLVTLTIYLWHWPSNLSQTCWSLMCVLKFSIHRYNGSACRAQADGQTDRHIQTLLKILPLLLMREVLRSGNHV